MKQTKGQRAVALASSGGDYVVLGVTFAVFFVMTGMYFIISYLLEVMTTPMSSAEMAIGFLFTMIGAFLLFSVFLLIGMFLVRMQRQMMLGNSLQVEYSDFAWLRDWANIVAKDLEMPRVEIFVTQNPLMNAYAFGFVRPYCIVLNSGSIRYLTREELKVVVVHEMAHIKYYHTHALVYLQPFMLFPVIGVAATWIAGFWQRRTELTADRLAYTYMQNGELVKSSLIKIHVGPDVAAAMNQTARDWLQYTAERPMNRLAQTFSSHPFLVRRLSHIDRQVRAAASAAKTPTSP